MDEGEDTAGPVYPLHPLTDLPEVMYRVFTLLPIKALNTCAVVCKSWHHTTNYIKKKHFQTFQHFFTEISPNNCGQVADVDISQATADFRQFAENISTEPQTMLIFCTGSLLSSSLPEGTCASPDLSKEINTSKQSLMEYMTKCLPSQTNLLCVGSVGCFGTGRNAKCLTVDGRRNKTATACLTIPKSSGITVHHFLDQWENPGAEEWLKENPWLLDQDIKCLLLFYDSPSYEMNLFGQELCKDIWKRRKGGLVLSGGYGYFSQLSVGQSRNVTSLCYCVLGIAFSGTNLEAASVTIDGQLCSENEVEDKIKWLHDSIPDNSGSSSTNSFGLCFICKQSFSVAENVEKDNYMKHTQAVTRAFHKVFPDIPLVGCILGQNVFTIGMDNTTAPAAKHHTPFPERDDIFTREKSVVCLLTVNQKSI